MENLNPSGKFYQAHSTTSSMGSTHLLPFVADCVRACDGLHAAMALLEYFSIATSNHAQTRPCTTRFKQPPRGRPGSRYPTVAYTLIDTMGPSMLVCVIACAALVQVTRRAATHAPARPPGAAARPLGRTDHSIQGFLHTFH